MAGFLDPHSFQPISTMTVTQGSKFRVCLWGGDPNGNRLNVTTAPKGTDGMKADPAVVFIKEDGAWNLIYEIDSNRIQSNAVRACWSGGDYSEPLTLNMRSISGFGKADARKAIVDLARTFVARSHYLWGTAGNRPGLADGNAGGGKSAACKLRAHSLDKTTAIKEQVLGICMAVQPNFDGYNTCAGRRGFVASPPADLDEYLKDCAKQIQSGNTDQTSWPGAGPGNNLYPRKYHFRGTMKQSAAARDVVWGESCQGIPHFDCVGLVNYCYAKHWHQPGFGLDIKAFRNSIQGTVQIANEKDLMDADILLKSDDSHIGMLYNSGKAWCVVQAESTEIGLTEHAAFAAASWDRFRMQDAYIKA